MDIEKNLQMVDLIGKGVAHNKEYAFLMCGGSSPTLFNRGATYHLAEAGLWLERAAGQHLLQKFSSKEDDSFTINSIFDWKDGGLRAVFLEENTPIVSTIDGSSAFLYTLFDCNEHNVQRQPDTAKPHLFGVCISFGELSNGPHGTLLSTDEPEVIMHFQLSFSLIQKGWNP